MTTFKDFYLFEADEQVKEKLKHLEHVEELIINHGYQGALRTINFLRRFVANLNQKDPDLQINMKIDGAPSIVFGNFPNQPLFVGTKSALSSTGKRYTDGQHDRIMAENAPGLAEKLIAALKHLPALKPQKVYQGDFLFSDRDLKRVTIDGVNCFVFKPNVITYAVPIDSQAGREVASAKLGIVVHTAYEGDTVANMHAVYNPTLNELASTPEVWIKNNRLEDPKNHFTGHGQSNVIGKHIDQASALLASIDAKALNAIVGDAKLKEMIKLHINSNIRQGRLIDDPHAHVDNLSQFIHDRLETSRATFKTAKKQQDITNQQQRFREHLATSKDQIAQVFCFFNFITMIKLELLKLVNVDDMGAYYEEAGKYRKTTGEGLVIADGKTNHIIKVVDRLDFSRINFNQQKDWK